MASQPRVDRRMGELSALTQALELGAINNPLAAPMANNMHSGDIQRNEGMYELMQQQQANAAQQGMMDNVIKMLPSALDAYNSGNASVIDQLLQTFTGTQLADPSSSALLSNALGMQGRVGDNAKTRSEAIGNFAGAGLMPQGGSMLEGAPLNPYMTPADRAKTANGAGENSLTELVHRFSTTNGEYTTKQKLPPSEAAAIIDQANGARSAGMTPTQTATPVDNAAQTNVINTFAKRYSEATRGTGSVTAWKDVGNGNKEVTISRTIVIDAKGHPIN